MNSRNETVEALRAVAALMVCMFHFKREHFVGVSFTAPMASYGYLGVEVFFVISGFIVPHAMYIAGYTLSTWPRFMLKRLIRLEPPYLVSIVIVMVLLPISALAPGFRGGPSEWNLGQVVAHLGYVNALIGWPWLNPVHWSLAIEFQFYILIGLLVPLLLALPPSGRLLVVGAVVAVSFALPAWGSGLILQHLPVFAAGILTFLAMDGLIGSALYWPSIAGLTALIFWRSGLATALAMAVPAILLVSVRLPRVRIIAWLGTLSYSLYLLHAPIGGRVMNLATRLPQNALIEAAAIAVALAASLAAAYGLWRFVENPARGLAATIRYRSAPLPAVLEPAR